VINPPDQNLPAALLLEMALEAKAGVPLREQFGVHRTMRVVARGAAVAHRLVLEYMRPALPGVTLDAGLVLRQQGGPATADG
jgi:hypothetical protein